MKKISFLSFCILNSTKGKISFIGRIGNAYHNKITSFNIQPHPYPMKKSHLSNNFQNFERYFETIEALK